MSLGGPACLHSQGDREDAEVFLNLLREIEDEGAPVTPELLQDKVSSLFARPDLEADERLQIMSMHKSKGLEFDTVILPGLGKRTGQDQSQLNTSSTLIRKRGSLKMAACCMSPPPAPASICIC